MLTLTIKKKWFDMILSGEKKEEYREIKPYYQSRFFSLFNIVYVCEGALINPFEEKPERKITFRNGYSRNSPSFIAKCTLSVGAGKEEWGAEKDRRYFILTIHEIMKFKQDGSSAD